MVRENETDWIEWAGGDFPHDEGVLIKARYFDESLETAERSYALPAWEFFGPDDKSLDSDIIAYRVVSA